jgi:hypothetical protein
MINHPNLEPITDKAYRLEDAWTVEFQVANDTYRLRIPEGYETDGASVPRILWPLLRPDGLIRAAAVAHDYGYGTYGKNGKNDIKGEVYISIAGVWTQVTKWDFPRKFWDEAFLNLMHQAGMSLWKRQAAYRSVKLFGWMFW